MRRSTSLPAPATGRSRAAAAPVALTALCALTVLTVVASGCAGSDGTGSPATTAPPPPSAATVTIADLAFDPRRVEVAVGGSVTWVNDDDTPHMLLSTTPNVIGSPLIGKAGSYTQGFSAPGEYRYYCTIHNSMKGTVIVR